MPKSQRLRVVLKVTSVLAPLFAATAEIVAQSAGSIASISAAPPTATEVACSCQKVATAPSSPWAFGTQIGSSWGDDLVSGHGLIGAGLLQRRMTGKGMLGVYLVANVSDLPATVIKGADALREKLREVALTPRGIDMRTYIELAARPPILRGHQLAGWLSGGYRVNALKEDQDSTATYAHQLRYSGGIELRFGAAGIKPVTIGVEYVGGFLADDQTARILELSSRTISTLEATIVIPLAKLRIPSFENTGILVQSIAGVSERMPSQGRVGILIAK